MNKMDKEGGKKRSQAGNLASQGAALLYRQSDRDRGGGKFEKTSELLKNPQNKIILKNEGSKINETEKRKGHFTQDEPPLPLSSSLNFE